MVRQTEVNGRQNGESATAGMRQDVMNFAHDLWSLAELQFQLFLIDLREGASRSAVPLMLLFAGIAFAFAAIPMTVLAIAWLLVNRAGFSQEAAFATLAVASAVAGAALLWFAWRRLQSALSVLKRSRNELTQNLSWIKESLRNRNPS